MFNNTSRIFMPRTFSFLSRTALFYPEGEGDNTDELGDDDNKAGNAGKDSADGAKEGAGDAGKDDDKKPLVTLERHKSEVGKLKARIADFEKAESERKKSEMTEVDRLKSELEEREKKLASYQAGEKKQDALAKAKAALAKDGRVIDPEKEDILNRSLRRMAFDESTLDDDVAELVQIASMPKSSGHKSIAGKGSQKDESGRDPLSYTGKELGEIHKESPERYEAIMAKRKQALASKRAKGE